MRTGMRPICAPSMVRKLDAVNVLLGGGAEADAILHTVRGNVVWGGDARVWCLLLRRVLLYRV